MRPAATILLVDDHSLLREGLRALLSSHAEYTVTGEAGTARQALELARQLEPDLVLLDISLPDSSGLDVIKTMQTLGKPPRIVVVSMHARLDLVAESFRAGALGYVLKDSAAANLLRSLDAVCRGERYLNESIASQVLLKLDAYAAKRSQPADPAYDHLTRREQQILRLLAEGRHVQDIATSLFISRKTVENHRASIYSKLGLSNLAELVHYAARMGLIDLDPGGI